LKKIKLRNKILINLGTFLVMLLIFFAIAEGVSRIAFTYTKEGPTAVNMQIFKANDKYVWGHLPGAVDYHGYGNPTPEIRINELGFRDDELRASKPHNTKRILALGDSFTFGMNVSHENIFTEQLQDILKEKNEDNNYEVLNMGAIGYTIDQQLLLLKEKGIDLDPDAVIINFFVGNDVTEFRRHEWITDQQNNLIKIIDKKHYVDESNRLRYKGEDEPASYFINFVNTRLQILAKKMGLNNDNNGPTLTWPAFLDPDDEHGDPNLPDYWQKAEISLKQIKDTLDENNIKLIVVAISMDVQTDKKYWDKYSEMYFDEQAYELSRPQAKLQKITQDLNIDFIDLLPYFREADPDLWYYYEEADPHWTNEGHQLTAEIIANNLQI